MKKTPIKGWVVRDDLSLEFTGHFCPHCIPLRKLIELEFTFTCPDCGWTWEKDMKQGELFT
jgi:hypothetical protein